ncbi:MAG: response regulator [Acidobacteria bacterium]|nr:response regulator [Acidobacteriota bacterium]
MPGPAGRRPRILVIEDEAEERRALALVLALDRYEVTAVGGGEDALRAMTASPPDLVIMDWRMPGLAGVPLCRAIRRRPHPPPIVVVSSADEAFTAGADILTAFRKPLDVEAFKDVVREATGG